MIISEATRKYIARPVDEIMDRFAKLQYMELWIKTAIAQINYTIDNPIRANDFKEVVLAFARLLVQIGIPLATIFIVFAGFKFVTARGDPKGIEEAKKMLFWTLVGAAVIIGAYAIATAVVNFAKEL